MERKALGKDSCCSHGLRRRKHFFRAVSLGKGIPQFCLKKQSLAHLISQGLEVTSSGSRFGSSQEKLGIQMHPFLPPSSLLWVAELRTDSPKVCLFSANISGFVFSTYSCFSWGISGRIPFPVSLGNQRTGTVYTHCHRSQVEVGDEREQLGQEHIQAVCASLGMQLEVTLVTDWLWQGFCHIWAQWLRVIFQLCKCRYLGHDGLSCGQLLATAHSVFCPLPKLKWNGILYVLAS